MKRIKVFGQLICIIAIAVCLFCCLFAGGIVTAYAEELPAEDITAPVEGNNEADDGEDGSGLQTLVEGFLTQLKAKYGEDYETYYNAILAEWGSVEEYLLSLVDDGTIPDVAADGWTAFLGWLNEYAPIWASILAIAAIIIIILLGKKALNKVAGFVAGMGAKYKVITTSINKMYQSDIAQSHALLKLLGENERFNSEREALKESVEEIEKNDEL